ncbi:S8 family serine peptidase [Flavobacterium sp.]|jgi:subtilisin-like proprotein convertase family protein|uniref:S8 family serine peptidase n=1 Tax=Flavobacterium sp. TaxID=239 RepID=UPI0037841A1F
MKIRTLLLIFSLVFSGFVFSQTKEDVEKITKNYDLEKIKELEVTYKKKEAAEKEAAYGVAKINGWPINFEKDGVFYELMKLTPDGNQPIYYATESNVIAARSTRANYLNTGGGLGLTIDGQNMIARVWDGGPVRGSHNAFYTSATNFASRVTNVDTPFATPSINSSHGTHVTGTILALPWNAGSAAVKGMATKATARTFDWTDDEAEAINEAANGMLLSNHSYGVPITGTSGPLPAWYIGAYVDDSRVWDEITYNAPFYLPVYSGGNDGDNDDNSEPISSGIDKLVGNKVAKNVLTVANAQDATIAADGSLTSVLINPGSSQGPTDDRRIKPDIAGNGTGLDSPISNSNTAISNYSGTSMAAPNVTGTLLLLQQHNKNVTNSFMKAATLKGLACHTADDAGTVGPDPYFGWGLLNAKKAAETISNNGLSSWISEQRLNQGQTFTMTVASAGGAANPLIASITWTDVPGEANNSLIVNDLKRALVNDLDIRITKDGVTTFFPWKLNSIDPSMDATRAGDNNIDNVEIIKIDNPVAGNYVITITHKGSLVNSGQDYSLVITGISSNFGLISKSDDVVLCSTANASYTFDYKQIGAGTTNFTATGVPVGAIVNFSPPSLSANGTVTMNVTNFGSVTPGFYNIGIVGNNGTETETRTKSLRVFSSTFTPITLTSPLNGFNGTPTSINLDWQDDINAENYLLQVSTTSTFTTTVVNQLVQESNFIASNLNQDTIYYWRVVPSNRCGSATNASAIVNSFKTGIISCGNIFNATDFSDATIATTANVTASVPINVTGGIIIGDLKVTLDISHTWIGDMIISLEGPASIGSPEIILLNQPCTGSGSTYPNILATLDEAGAALVCEATAPVVRGIAAPFESFINFNGLNADGVWTLKVSDVGNQDGGSINAVSLNFCNVVPGTLSSNDNVLGSLKVYPNPAKGIVNIDLGNVTGDTTYELFDVQGRKVISKVSSTNFETLNVESLSDGIYMLTVQNGSAKTTKKLVINK